MRISSTTGLTLALATMLAVAVPISAKIIAGDITGGSKAPHLNVAIFHSVHGQENFKYPNHIAKANILSELAGHAQFIAINHTAGLKDGDIVSIANDVLRDNAGAFEDFGVDCQIVIHQQDKAVQLAGLCDILMTDADHRTIEHKGVIKPISVDSGADWQLLYFDQADGIAVYADSEFGLE